MEPIKHTFLQRIDELDKQLDALNRKPTHGEQDEADFQELTRELDFLTDELLDADVNADISVTASGQARCNECGTPLTDEQAASTGACWYCGPHLPTEANG